MHKKVTLSYDNGPDLLMTPEVLDILNKHNVKTSFFVIGEKIKGAEAVIEQAYKEGHWIGNHSYYHDAGLGEHAHPDAPNIEITQTQKLIEQWVHPNKFFRPCGDGGCLDKRLLSPAAVKLIQQQAYTTVLWNCVPGDWKNADWVSVALQQCEKEAHPLVVIHDFLEDADKKLDLFIQELKLRDYEIIQEFPRDCLPFINGKKQFDVNHLINDNWSNETSSEEII